MKKSFLILFVVLLQISCAKKRPAVIGETEFQQELNADFKDASKSPLKAKDLKTFEALDFFPVDNSYRVNAMLETTPNSPVFTMPATKEKTSKYRRFGILTFTLKGKEFSLEVYRNQDLMKTEKYKNHLFLPFTDETNGFASYGGGRYIDLEIPLGNLIQIDFNKAYNPYCAYNDTYSCPIPPRVNFLQTEIKAGVKSFDKH
ncbi:hypothetical protein KORDIASMS9_04425 [Kordia sp. SMS9]|uniref:DUF1684 domain-containing protein n=1 Tax=Kordia sp. SMS9 TaxID=2282170 RepID=UPI000E0D12B2|nr:DUF1684 domain-containing protein [Kordia sp. SMS9]AXG72157.1 hypothetical protein KORDIASMS9_04425 [Kordia sp. SMS9]